MESGTTLTVALLPEPAFISPSETVMAHSPSQRPMTFAGIGTSNLMSAGISVATSTPPILLNSAGPAFKILFLRVDGVMCGAPLARARSPRARHSSMAWMWKHLSRERSPRARHLSGRPAMLD